MIRHCTGAADFSFDAVQPGRLRRAALVGPAPVGSVALSFGLLAFLFPFLLASVCLSASLYEI